MALYKYKAKTGPREMVDGVVDARSEKEAVEKLSQMGYTPVLMEKEMPAEQDKKAVVSRSSIKIKSREISVFSRQLASLLKSGVPILSAINIIYEQSENPRLKELLGRIYTQVKEGVMFSQALSIFPRSFSPLFVAMTRTGEDSGNLPEALMRIADYRAKQDEMLSRFRMALAYPLLMAAVGLGTVIFMFSFVIPRLMRVYIQLGQNLPLPTKMIIAASDGLRQWWFWIVLALIVFILVIRRQIKTDRGARFVSALRLRLPVFGNFVLKAELSRFCRTLGLLIKSGLPILNAIDISIPVLESELIKDLLKKGRGELQEGASFGAYLKKARLIPPFMSSLIIVGEESGKLDDSLNEIANIYERDTDEAIKIFSTLLEPVMILVMGLVVGFIVIAMLLPIFDINVMAR